MLITRRRRRPALGCLVKFTLGITNARIPAEGGYEMKERIGSLLVFVSCVSLLVLSVPAVAQNAPDVEVSDLQWTHDVNRGHRLKGYYPRSPAPSPDFVQKVSATFRNVGTKPVKSLTWEYIVYEDSDPSKVVRTYKFRSKTRLRPGESERLSKVGLGIQYRRQVEARVIKVEYADGTVWQVTKS
jgi:hypothetical protein